MENKYFTEIRKIDKQIFKIYTKIKIKKENKKYYNDEIEELKKLVELEDWLYKKISINSENIDELINKLLEKNEFEYSLDYFIRKNCQCFSLNKYEYLYNENDINKLINYRIYYKLLYLNNEIEDYDYSNELDEKTGIYTYDNKISYVNNSERDYINYSRNTRKRVIAFDDETKSKLQQKGYIDTLIMNLLVLEVGFENEKFKRAYNNNLYNYIFINKSLEEIFIKDNFDCELMLNEFSDRKRTFSNNKDFIKMYRSHYCYKNCVQILNSILKIKLDNFYDDVYGEFYKFQYSLLIYLLKSNLTFLEQEDYDVLLMDFDTKRYLEKRNDKITERIESELYYNYKKLKKILTKR